jgi:hypothetical protein
MHKRRTQEFIRELAKKYNQPIYVIQGIVNSPFVVLAEKMRESKVEESQYDTVYIQSLGKFIVAPSRELKAIAKYKESRKYKRLLKEQQNDLP